MALAASCVLGGLSDALTDAEVWRLDLTLADPTTGAPFNLTGSELTVTFRTLMGWEVVTTCSSAAGTNHEPMTITDAANGKVSIVSIPDPNVRPYRVPVPSLGFPAFSVTIIGDVQRRLSADPTSQPENLGQIRFPIRASTTRWPATS